MRRLSLPAFIADGMVIQRGAAFPLWGRAAPAAQVTVRFLDKTYRAQADAGGAWRVTLDPADAGGPFTLRVSAAEAAREIQDVYAGDLWLCSGQSNMELMMERLKDDFPEEWQPPVNPLIRQFTVPQEWDASGPWTELDGGFWTAASPETLPVFSGTAWFFAKKMYEKYRIPIGLIKAAWGGTPVEAWMSREALAAFPDMLARAALYADSQFRERTIKQNEAELRAWEDKTVAEDRGLQEAWYQASIDESPWDELSLPGDFAAPGPGYTRLCGVIWLRRTFRVPPGFASAAARLWLGTITDADTVYINGVEAGSTGYRYPPRKYPVPAGLLHEGENQITIRVVCNNGDGGVTQGKPFRLFSERGAVELGGVWKCRIGMRAPPCPAAFFIQRQPSGLFNTMIAPLLAYPLAGALWYQGESNDGRPGEYAALFAALIKDWRRYTRQDDLPFLFVQLPLFGPKGGNTESSSWAILREAQSAALALPATGMAAALDLGEWNDLHPVNKKGVGERLFLAADQVVFNSRNTAPGPVYRAFERRDGKLLLFFDNCGAGLRAVERPYVSAAAAGVLTRLPADIEGPDCLSVDISMVDRPERLYYAWADNPQDRQLYNADGLPMIPFRIAI